MYLRKCTLKTVEKGAISRMLKCAVGRWIQEGINTLLHPSRYAYSFYGIRKINIPQTDHSRNKTSQKVKSHFVSDGEIDENNIYECDFSGQYYDRERHSSSLEDHIRLKTEADKPHLVILKNIEEHHYLMKMKCVLRGLGYEGNFQDARKGRGDGVFLRSDLSDGRRKGSVFRSRRPNPR